MFRGGTFKVTTVNSRARVVQNEQVGESADPRAIYPEVAKEYSLEYCFAFEHEFSSGPKNPNEEKVVIFHVFIWYHLQIFCMVS